MFFSKALSGLLLLGIAVRGSYGELDYTNYTAKDLTDYTA